MTVLVVPALEEEPWPTLGPLVCDFAETYLSFGPGDLRGQPYRFDDEKRALVYRMYEVFPEGHAQAGRRRFKRVAISLRKGSAKTELAAIIAAVELHPDGPVRCGGWDGHGNPLGHGVTDPYIPLVAYTEEQTEDLAYGALKTILEASPLAGDFDIGLERVMRRDGSGMAKALAAAPSAREGARTTFAHYDETHRFTLERLRQAHSVMQANIPKRFAADAWSLETTTAYGPGEGSVAEDTFDYARKVESGAIKDSALFFFHRQAGDGNDLQTEEGRRAAVMEASGPVAGWSDIEGILVQGSDPTTDLTYWERVWCNRPVRSALRAFDVEKWKTLAIKGKQIPAGALITLGFDGSRSDDSTGLVATDVKQRFQQVLGVWERPPGALQWRVPVEEVKAAVDEAFATFNVWRMYCDPPYWEGPINEWAGKYGKDRVIEWWTNRWKPMAYAIRAFVQAIAAGELHHSGDARYTAHMGNAVRKDLLAKDEDGRPLWWIQKERPDSPNKIDLDMSGILSWEACNDAIAAGAAEDEGPSVYEDRGVLVL